MLHTCEFFQIFKVTPSNLKVDLKGVILAVINDTPQFYRQDVIHLFENDHFCLKWPIE
jgi:hypothetical protein